jgi:2-oxoisovalerate dehydrogenase E1 component
MPTEKHLANYQRMLTIREFEEAAMTISQEGDIAGSIHLCFGQEAIPVGATNALRADDQVLSTYRGHGWALAKGTDPAMLMAELLQRSGGTNGGRAGSALLSDPDRGFLGENSIVGAGFPIANGVGLASERLGKDQVVLTSVGDGAMSQGSVTEALVFGAAYDLPVIFMCENNLWAEMTFGSDINRLESLSIRAEALGIRSFTVDGNDPEAVEDVIRQAVEICRGGDGPVFVEAKTFRLRGHYNRDIEHYRSKEDKELAVAADPLKRLRRRLTEELGVDESEIAAIEEEVTSLVRQISHSARQSPVPDPATVYEHLYAPSAPTEPAPMELPESAKSMTYQRAVNLALATELEERDNVILFGEDIAVAGGTFGATRGLQKRFGGNRIFDTPIAEASIIGAGIGAAMTGMRPIIEIMWADFLFVAFDQLINQATNVRYINRSRLNAPLTIRMQQGVTPGSCAQHSQSIEALLAHIPGIKVGLASTPQDAYAMLRAAVADEDPTVVIESRSLYQESGQVDLEAPVQGASGARFHRRGKSAAIITWGQMLMKAVVAADLLAAEGIDATVLDLRWLRPLDLASIDEAVRASGGRIVVVHEAFKTGGFGAEIAAYVSENHFSALSAPVTRIATQDLRMPSAPTLQEAALPQVSDIAQAVRDFFVDGEAASLDSAVFPTL